MNASDNTNPSAAANDNLTWLWWLVGGTAVAGVGGIVLASYAGKKAAQVLPHYAAYERAENDEERAARARSLARAAVGDNQWLLKRAHRVLGLEGLDFAPAPVAAAPEVSPPVIEEWHREHSLFDEPDVVQGLVYGKPGIRDGEPIEVTPLSGQKIERGRVVKTARSAYRLGQHAARRDFGGRK